MSPFKSVVGKIAFKSQLEYTASLMRGFILSEAEDLPEGASSNHRSPIQDAAGDTQLAD